MKANCAFLVAAILVEGATSICLRQPTSFASVRLNAACHSNRILVAKAAVKEEPRTLAELLGVKDIPVDGPVIFGSAGFVTGMAIKKLGKLIGYSLVALSVGVHMIERNGYITIHWNKIQKDITNNPSWKKLDANNDGKIEMSEFQDWLSTLQRVAIEAIKSNTQGLSASGAAFAGGALAGFNMG